MTIVTIKWGQRYSAMYVNNLLAGTRRFGLAQASFVCFTDDSSGLDPGIDCRPLPDIDLPDRYRCTFWRKLALFNPELGITGPCLYFDLDVAIVGDLEPLIRNWTGKPRFIRNWIGRRTLQRGKPGCQINSSVVLYDPKSCDNVLRTFYANREQILNTYPSDQGFLYDALAEGAEFFDPKLCVSFKRHCLAHFPLNLLLKPQIPPGAAVVLFHGKPDPHEAAQGYMRGKWKHRCRKTPWAFPQGHR